MGLGDSTDTAAGRLHALHTYFREHPATGPTVRSAPSTTPGAPLNLGMIDHIQSAVAEVVALTREVNPDAGQLPNHVAAVYDWCRQNTEHAPEAAQQRRDTLELRHRLEHAIRAGDFLAIRPMRCPACHTLGLHWQAQTFRAVCMNRHCANAHGGTHRTWSLARLAHERVRAEKMLRDCAT